MKGKFEKKMVKDIHLVTHLWKKQRKKNENYARDHEKKHVGLL